MTKIFSAGIFVFVGLILQTSFNVSKRSPIHFFLLCKKMDVQKHQSPPLYILGIMRRMGDQKNFEKKLQKNPVFFHFFIHAGVVEENT